jgi:hypothetical protein
MARADNPDFVEAIERGLEVIRVLGAEPDGPLALARGGRGRAGGRRRGARS